LGVDLIVFRITLPGQYHDVETGLHYNYFRYYDPETGRYITSDPIGLLGGLNTFGYVRGNPLYWSDPLGLDPYLVGRPLSDFVYAGHMFDVTNASYIGDPNATIYSYGMSDASKRHGRNTVTGLMGRVDNDTENKFSATTHADDWKYWLNLGGAVCSTESPHATPIPATDAVVDYWANRLKPSIKYHVPIPGIGRVNAVNSNSGAQAVANLASSSNVPRPIGPIGGYPGASQWHRVEFR